MGPPTGIMGHGALGVRRLAGGLSGGLCGLWGDLCDSNSLEDGPLAGCNRMRKGNSPTTRPCHGSTPAGAWGAKLAGGHRRISPQQEHGPPARVVAAAARSRFEVASERFKL